MGKVARIEPKLRLVQGQGAVPGPAAAPSPTRPAFDDSELLGAIRRGDPNVATALHDRVRPQVDRTVRRLLGGRDPDVCDLAQQSMIEIVNTIDRYRGECSLDSWTSAIAAHVVYKHIRRRRTERRIFGGIDGDFLDQARSSSRIAREAIVRNLLRRVLTHLEQVEEAKAWAFVLHDVCGYDLREIAQITGVSAAAAQTRLMRGRREVHQRIASDPELADLLESMEGHS
jgi:RNA polymerase sigma-70 factor (ECF subfamily)